MFFSKFIDKCWSQRGTSEFKCFGVIEAVFWDQSSRERVFSFLSDVDAARCGGYNFALNWESDSATSTCSISPFTGSGLSREILWVANIFKGTYWFTYYGWVFENYNWFASSKHFNAIKRFQVNAYLNMASVNLVLVKEIFWVNKKNEVAFNQVCEDIDVG